MTPTPPFNPTLIDRVLSGDANEDERALVEAWATADPRHGVLLDALRAQFAASSGEADTDAAWRALRAKMAVPAGVRSLDAKRREKIAAAVPKRSWGIPLRIAAGLLLVAGSATLWQLRFASIESPQQSLSAPAGETRVATLSDGTRMTLAPGSRAHWRRDLEGKNREVYLEGEGYFDVVHDSSRPFRVRARNAVVEDVGTRFVVRAWPELTEPEVAVEEGIVLLADSVGAARGASLTAGQFGRLKSDGQVTITAVPEGTFAWLRQELVFNDAPLSVALPSLGRWYDVDLRADSSLAGRQLSARFTAQPLPQILDALTLALDARVVRSGRVITLVKRTP